MPQDYGDSWDQGQRCCFAFSPFGVTQNGVNNQKEPVYVYETQPFFQYDINRGGGSSNTKIFNAIKLNTSITLTCTWQTHDEGKPGKPDIKANKIEVNQVIKVTGGSAIGSSGKSYAEFIGLVQSINQPDKSISKGVLVVKPIYILQNVFDKTSPIENWSVICNENKTSNYEINKDYASVEAFGLTGTSVGNGDLSIFTDNNYITNNSNQEHGGTQTQYSLSVNVPPGYFEDGSIAYDGISSSINETIGDEPNTGTQESITSLDYYGRFSVNYSGDINYYPWDEINVSGNIQKIIITEIHTFKQKQENYEENSDISTYTSYRQYLEYGDNQTQKQKSSISINYTFGKTDFDKTKLYSQEQNTEITKTNFNITMTDTFRGNFTILTSGDNLSISSEAFTAHSSSTTRSALISTSTSTSESILGLLSVKINPSDFSK